MRDHVTDLSLAIEMIIQAYEAKHKDCDVNDVLSALACLLVQYCKDFDVPRTELLRNMSETYERFEDVSRH